MAYDAYHSNPFFALEKGCGYATTNKVYAYLHHQEIIRARRDISYEEEDQKGLMDVNDECFKAINKFCESIPMVVSVNSLSHRDKAWTCGIRIQDDLLGGGDISKLGMMSTMIMVLTVKAPLKSSISLPAVKVLNLYTTTVNIENLAPNVERVFLSAAEGKFTPPSMHIKEFRMENGELTRFPHSDILSLDRVELPSPEWWRLPQKMAYLRIIPRDNFPTGFIESITSDISELVLESSTEARNSPLLDLSASLKGVEKLKLKNINGRILSGGAKVHSVTIENSEISVQSDLPMTNLILHQSYLSGQVTNCNVKMIGISKLDCNMIPLLFEKCPLESVDLSDYSSQCDIFKFLTMPYIKPQVSRLKGINKVLLALKLFSDGKDYQEEFKEILSVKIPPQYVPTIKIMAHKLDELQIHEFAALTENIHLIKHLKHLSIHHVRTGYMEVFQNYLNTQRSLQSLHMSTKQEPLSLPRTIKKLSIDYQIQEAELPPEVVEFSGELKLNKRRHNLPSITRLRGKFDDYYIQLLSTKLAKVRILELKGDIVATERSILKLFKVDRIVMRESVTIHTKQQQQHRDHSKALSI